MATLEEAAEALVVKLKGLDAEIAEAETKIDGLREALEKDSKLLDRAWEATRTAAASAFAKMREEEDLLAERVQDVVEAVAEGKNALVSETAVARGAIDESSAALAASGRQVAALEPSLVALATEAGEEPARRLAERARALEQELAHLVQEAVAFVQHEVPAAIEDVVEQVREASAQLQERLAETAVEALQDGYVEWETGLTDLEEQLEARADAVSQQHARGVVEHALEECGTACGTRVDATRQVVALLSGQLEEMAAEVARSADELVARAGRELLAELDTTRMTAVSAALALDGVRGTLAAYSFVEG